MSVDRAAFGEIRCALERIGRWHEEFAPMVTELLELRALQADVLAAYRENPWAVGSRGQPVEHPLMRQYLAVQVRTLALAETLLLTPRARARAGVAVVERDPLEEMFDAPPPTPPRGR
jgi:hypothetical protein